LLPRPPPSPLFPSTTLFRSGFAGLFSAALLVAVLVTVPRVPGRRVPIHAPGIVVLMLSIGLFVVAATMVGQRVPWGPDAMVGLADRKSTRLNSSHVSISYAV